MNNNYIYLNCEAQIASVGCKYLKSSFPKRYKSILIVFMKMTFFYLDPYILLIFNLSRWNGLLAQSEHVKQWLLNPPGSAPSHRAGLEPGFPAREAGALTRNAKGYSF